MSQEFDEDVYDGPDNDGGASADEAEEILLDVRPKDVWSTAGPKKNEVVRELIKCFGSMIESHPKEYAIPDHNGRFKPEDLVFEKLLDAPKYVAKAKRALIVNENFDTRNFSLFISNKRWMKNILRPLLELCAKDDSNLAMRCCSLSLVLIRRLSDSSQKILTEATRGSKRKASSLDLQQNEDDKEETEKLKPEDEARMKEKEQDQLMVRIENVKQQVAALLSFKEALCSDKCNEAISNAFKEFWLKEQSETSEDNKMGVAICFSYLRRILAIEAHAQWSSAGEVQLHRVIHDRYVVQLRLLLSVIPGVCSDLLRSYHNDWLGDVILIIYFTLRGFEPKELHQVWKTGALIEDFENFDSHETEIDAEDIVRTSSLAPAGAAAAKKPIDVVIPTSLAQANRQSSAVGKGKLSQMLQKERNNRLLSAPTTITTGPRYRGVYQRTVHQNQPLPVLPTTATATTAAAGATSRALDHILGAAPTTTSTTTGTAAQTSDDSSTPAVCHLQTSKILRNPFTQAVAAIPTQQAKRNKKNLTFALDSTLSEVSNAQYLVSDDHQKATVVAATLANLLSNELSLKPLVKRVNEDLRRDDMRVGQELELRYFDIIYRVLHYNRLKIADDYRQHLKAVAGGASAAVEVQWEPNLKNVMDALDRMSFTRVVTAVERVGKNAMRTEDVVVPMSLYKEMVCYLRVLLESGLEGHHEIAIAALHRLFYASSERLDPLPRLLASWKSGTYPRRHLDILVELVHETLKTLEVAQLRFRPEGDKNAEEWARKKYKKSSKGRNEMDLEQYVMACMRFRVDDYFKRLVTNSTVRMYTRLLSLYEKNDSNVNHYVYCFLRRLNAFTLEQDHKAPSPNPSTEPSEVSLGFMLFNIHSLEVFNTIVNDRNVYDNKEMEPLLRLVKAILRRFGEAAEKNHMLFVEVLFAHQRPHDFCCQLDSVYEAPSYAAYQKRATVREGPGSEDSATSSSESEAEDYGDEFDETNISAAFAATKDKKSEQEAARLAKREARAKEKAERKRSKEAHKSKRHRGDTAGADKAQLRASRFAWTAEEDAILKEQYVLYAGTASIFTSIAQNPELKALGMNRGEAQVAKRVRELRLNEQISYSDDEEMHSEEEELDITASTTGKDKASTGSSAFRKNIFSDDEGEEDDLGLNDSALLSPEGSSGNQRRQYSSTQEATQIDTQYDTQRTAFSASSPLASAPNTAPKHRHTGSGGAQDEDYAAVFSPSDTSLNDDIEQEGKERDAANTAVSSQSVPTASVDRPSTAKKPRLRAAAEADQTATAGRAAWDIDENEPDLLEQRAMALMKATGGAHYAGLSDDESLTAAGKKQKRAPAARKGLVKRVKTTTAVKNTAVASDDEDELFVADESTEQTSTQVETQVSEIMTQEQREQAAQTHFKKRLMRIESDDEDE